MEKLLGLLGGLKGTIINLVVKIILGFYNQAVHDEALRKEGAQKNADNALEKGEQLQKEVDEVAAKPPTEDDIDKRLENGEI